MMINTVHKQHLIYIGGIKKKEHQRSTSQSLEL